MPTSTDPSKRAVQLANLRRGAGPGNAHAVRHGAGAEQRLAPLREAFARDIRVDYPALDGRRVALLADRLARLESAHRWLDGQGGVVRNARGQIYDVADRAEKWSARAEDLLREAEAEARAAHSPGDALQAHLEKHYGAS